MEVLQYLTQLLPLVVEVVEMKDQMEQEDLVALVVEEDHQLQENLVAQDLEILEEHLDLLHLQMGGVMMVVLVELLQLMPAEVVAVLDLLEVLLHRQLVVLVEMDYSFLLVALQHTMLVVVEEVHITERLLQVVDWVEVEMDLEDIQMEKPLLL